MSHARIRLSAPVLRLKRIDAGAAAIALVPRHDFTADAGQAGLVEKAGRWLLTEAADDVGRSQRVQALLETLVAE